MRKVYFLLLLLLPAAFMAISQTTAIDFKVKDCSGDSQKLYSIIDSGNVVILVYEHQCSSCITGSKNLKAVIQSNYTTNKKIRLIYLDNGGFSCSSVSTWITNNNLLKAPIILYSGDYSSPYGSGMPVIVITSGSSHHVFLKTISAAAADTGSLHNGIKNALDALNGIDKADNKIPTMEIFPNPVIDGYLQFSINHISKEKLTVEILNINGELLSKLPSCNALEGLNQFRLQLPELKSGIYFVSIQSTDYRIIQKLIIAR